ncbi:CD151 antigen-like [Hydractinia symbiolongicarpus]|uniref:CD151 antigen-like n=1 Tax=Hydractinia symbiolongicarpus TaxID=13093 RepID=UPI002551C294|nr:CD151 antigen-like [Hydractinia symbiolongicarpus]
MGTGKLCIKYLLFSFNVVFWLAGLAAIGAGIWMLFDPGRFNDFLGKYTFTIPASILIATGLFVTCVGFCGCWGAIRENKCMLGTYFTMLLLIFCAEVAAGVLGFLYRDKIKDEVTSESQSVIQNKYGTGDKDIDYAVDTVQEKLECCGANGYGDYTPSSKWYLNRGSAIYYVPPSCCSTQSKCLKTTDTNVVYTKGCIDELVKYTKDNMMILGGIGIGLACVQLLGMCFACCLFFAIDDY